MSCRCAERELRVSRVNFFLQGNFHFLEAACAKDNKKTLDLRAWDTAQHLQGPGFHPQNYKNEMCTGPEVRASELEPHVRYIWGKGCSSVVFS